MNTLDFEIQKKRQFGEFISDGFAIFRQHFRVLSISFLKYVLPFVIIGGYLYGAFFSKLFNNVLAAQEGVFSSATNVALLFICVLAIMVGYAIMQCLVYGMFHHKLTNEQSELTSEYLGNFIWSNIGKLFLLFLIIILLVTSPVFLIAILFSLIFVGGLPSAGLIALLTFLLFIYFFVVTYYMFAWYLAPFIIVHEGDDVGVIEALRRSKNLLSGYWWSLAGLLFVAGLIASVLSLVFTLPLQIALMSMDVTAISTEGISSLSLGLYGMLSFVGSTFVGMYTVICLVLKYIDLKERKEGSSLINKIESFGNDKESTFENEGEY